MTRNHCHPRKELVAYLTRDARAIRDARTMLLLFETPAGYALFKTSDKKLAAVEDIFQEFTSAEKASAACVFVRRARRGRGCRLASRAPAHSPPPLPRRAA